MLFEDAVVTCRPTCEYRIFYYFKKRILFYFTNYFDFIFVGFQVSTLKRVGLVHLKKKKKKKKKKNLDNVLTHMSSKKSILQSKIN